MLDEKGTSLTSSFSLYGSMLPFYHAAFASVCTWLKTPFFSATVFLYVKASLRSNMSSVVSIELFFHLQICSLAYVSSVVLPGQETTNDTILNRSKAFGAPTTALPCKTFAVLHRFCITPTV